MAQLGTVNVCIRQIFGHSDGANVASKTNMQGTRTVLDTRRCETNKSQIDSNYGMKQLFIDEEILDHSEVNNNKNEENQNARFFRSDGPLRSH